MTNFLKSSSEKIKLKHFIFLITGILGFLILFYVYNRQQNSVELYATGIMGASGDIFLAVPYWVSNSINVGDRDISPLGMVSNEIIDKETFEGGSHGRHVVLQMKLKVILDRNGKYYYRNKQLQVNDWFDLNLGNVNEKIYLIYVGKKPAEYTIQKLMVKVKKESELPLVIDNLNPGDKMINNKGELMAKLVSKITLPAEIRSYSQDGLLVITKDPNRRDLELTVEIIAKRKDNVDYFGELRKVRVGEKLNLFFNEATLWDGIISSVEEIKNPDSNDSPSPPAKNSKGKLG